MTEIKKKKQFGVWMDTHQATIVGRADADSTGFTVLGVAGDAGADPNDKTKHHDKSPHLQHRFFKEILFYMHNADEVHVTGTGTSQEQLINYMAGTPQFKDTVTNESTSNKMSDENLAAYISAKFN